MSSSLNTNQSNPHPHPQLSLPTAAHQSSKTMSPQHQGSVFGLVSGKKNSTKKIKKKHICFVLTDLRASFKRILFSNKDTSVTRMVEKQHKHETEGVAQDRIGGLQQATETKAEQ